MRVDSAIENSYTKLSSMKRINSAADDPAGLAISQKLDSQVNGYNTAADNGLAMNDLTKTADGALGSVQDDLQRMRDLAVQASNGTLTANDKKIIQNEINQIKGDIGNTVKNTEFNTLKVLDGTFTNKEIAFNPSGTGAKMTIQDTGLQTLGIDQFNVTGSFDISDIDNAISKVSDARSNLGATSNKIMSAVNYNNIASSNLAAADSQISDLDVASQITQLNTQQILQQFSYFAQKQSLSQKAGGLNLLA